MRISKQIDAARTRCIKETGRAPTELKLTRDDLNKAVQELGNLNLLGNYTFTHFWGMKFSLINDGSTSCVAGINASSFAI